MMRSSILRMAKINLGPFQVGCGTKFSTFRFGFSNIEEVPIEDALFLHKNIKSDYLDGDVSKFADVNLSLFNFQNRFFHPILTMPVNLGQKIISYNHLLFHIIIKKEKKCLSYVFEIILANILGITYVSFICLII